jgi:hypothetical protein
MGEKVKEALIQLFEEKCNKETRLFRTPWSHEGMARLWEIDQDTVVIRFDRDWYGGILSTTGVLRNKAAIERLKRAYDEALKQHYMAGDEVMFGRKMIRAIKKEFIHVDEYIDKRRGWHAGGCKDFLQSGE